MIRITYIILLLLTFGLWADEAVMTHYREMLERNGFNENTEMRRKFINVLKSPVFPNNVAPFVQYTQVSDGLVVQFELNKTTEAWYAVFSNQKGEMPQATWPNWGKGTWIVKKELGTDRFLQVKIFLLDQEDSFVRIFPRNNGRSTMDIFLYGQNMGQGIILPTAFDDILTTPFAGIIYMSANAVSWDSVYPNPDMYGYRIVEYFVNVLKPWGQRIVEIDDAAIDRGGNNVFIESGIKLSEEVKTAGLTGLNCAGYVKWVADGIYSAWANSPGSLYMDIDDLRQPTTGSNKNAWSQSRSAANPDSRNSLEILLRDPNFGLDWNRNLAWKIESVRLNREIIPDEQSQLESVRIAGLRFQKENGYTLNDLPGALYQLAVRKPGTVYFAAVNSRFVPKSTPLDPAPLPLLQYWHVAVLAPWFEAGTIGRGTFHVAVMDTGDVAETLLKQPGNPIEPKFIASIRRNAIRYARLGLDEERKPHVPEIMVHLIQVKLPVNFQPMPLP